MPTNATPFPNKFKGSEEFRLEEPIKCFIHFILNITDSVEKTLEEWQYYHNPNTAPFERMEHVGRPVIYGIDMESLETESSAKVSKTTYKLILKDTSDNYFYAVELDELPFLRPREKTTKNPLPIPLGGCLEIMKGAMVADGIVLLHSSVCKYLGEGVNPVLVQQLNDQVVQKYINFLRQLQQANRSL